MYSLRDIDRKIRLARKAGLSGVELLEQRDRARTVCNGIGADWMPDWLRKLISRLFPALVLAADIHDIRYYLGGTSLARLLADVEMLENGCRLAEYAYGRFDPRRHIVQHVMLRFFMTLRKYGAMAWVVKETDPANLPIPKK